MWLCTFLGGGGGACTALVFFSASLPEALSYLTWIYRLESVSDKIRKKWLHFSHCTKRVEAAKQKENNVKNIFLSNWSQIKSRYKALVNDSKNKRCWSASNNGSIKSKIQPQLTVCYLHGQLLILSIVYVKTKIAKMSINIGNPKGKKCCLPMTALWYNIIRQKKECEHFIRGSKHWVLIVSRCLKPLMKHEAQVFDMASEVVEYRFGKYGCQHFKLLAE